MAILEIYTFPDQILRKKAETVTVFDQELERTVQSMLETMYVSSGIGLAAIQAGILKQIIVIDLKSGEEDKSLREPHVFINPKIVTQSGTTVSEEGCLSVPGFTGIIERSVTIDASYLDQNKSKIKLTASELLSQAIEHEIDHLNGIVYLDHLKSHEDLHKSGVTPNDIHWHDIGYKIFINKAKASSQDKIIDEVIDKKIELSKIKSDSSIDEASVDI